MTRRLGAEGKENLHASVSTIFISLVFFGAFWFLYQVVMSSQLTSEMLVITTKRSQNLHEMNRVAVLLWDDVYGRAESDWLRTRARSKIADGLAIEERYHEECAALLEKIVHNPVFYQLLHSNATKFDRQLNLNNETDGCDVFHGELPDISSTPDFPEGDLLGRDHMPRENRIDLYKDILRAIDNREQNGSWDLEFIDLIHLKMNEPARELHSVTEELAAFVDHISERFLPIGFFLMSFGIFSVWAIYIFHLKPLIKSIIAKRIEIAAICDALPVRIWKLKPDGTITYERSDIPLGKNIYKTREDNNPKADALRHAVKSQLFDTLQHERSVGRFKIDTEDDQESYFIRTTDILRAPNGVVSEVLIIHQDVTEMTLLEEEVVIRRKIEIIGTLAASVAHDFNNILGVISGASELIEQGNRDPKLFQAIRNSVRSCNRITHRMLSLKGVSNLVEETFDLCHLIQETVSDLESCLSASNIKLSLNIACTTAVIQCDKEMLRVAFFNLVRNARLASKSGDVVEISLDLSANTTANEPRLVTLAVSDHGVGMSKHVLENCKRPFFTTRSESGGTGLGLSSIDEFVAHCGGRFEISSKLGVGTIARLQFPILEQREQLMLDAPSEAEERGKNLRILIVDDDEAMLNIVTLLFHQLGHSTTPFQDGKAALEHLSQNPDYDVLLTDIVMPSGLSGLDVAEKAILINDQIKLLFMTGYNNENFQEFFNKIGFEIPVLRKPASRECIERVLAELVSV